MKKKVIDCTIKELAEYCKKQNKGEFLSTCSGCKLLATSKYCLVSYPIGILKGVKNKTIEVDNEKENR